MPAGRANPAGKGRVVEAALPTRGSKQNVVALAPSDDEEDSDEDEEDEDEEDDDSGDEDEDEEEEEEDDDDDDFEQQSSDDDSIQSVDAESDEDIAKAAVHSAESRPRKVSTLHARNTAVDGDAATGQLGVSRFLHTDDLSSDDEEDPQGNVIGRVPLHWYDAYDHIGYNVEGGKVVKRKGKDRIDMALDNRDDPAARRTIYDMYNDREIVLSERDLEIIRRIQAGAFAHPEHDDTPDYVPYASGEKEVMPIWGVPEPKRRFVPSKWEYMKVVKIVKAMREGRYKTAEERHEEKKKERQQGSGLRMMWNEDEDEVLAESKRHQYHLPAPKMPLPGHAESYNPPAEYLLSAEEKAAQEKLDPEDRLHNFIPKAHACLRHVAGYENFVRERFERCLDLYLCPRKLKKRLNIDPETLVPRLPRPRELKPFPNSLALQFLGHKKAVRCLAVSPDGQYLVSGGDDGTVRVWEVDTCLCRHSWQLGKAVKGDANTDGDGGSSSSSSSSAVAATTIEPILAVAWNPSPSHCVVAAAVGSRVILINTGLGDADAAEVTEALLASALAGAAASAGAGRGQKKGGNDDDDDSDKDKDSDAGSDDDSDKEGGGGKDKAQSGGRNKAVCSWHKSDAAVVGLHGAMVGPRVVLRFSNDVTVLSWHHKGDYLATLCPGDGTKSVAIHQVSKSKSQTPFNKNPGLVQAVAFHPIRPFLFVATQQHVKVFNLIEQKLVKRLVSGCKWLSCLAVHPSGDHLVVGSYDRRVAWFDLDLSSTPFKTLKFHEKAVRSAQFHPRYPLLASGSDDGSVHVFHATVYSDLTKNPLVVPLKVLRSHGGAGVLSVAFHPRQPWLFSSGSDGIISLFQDI